MSDIATKLQYLNTTKGKIKDVINKTNAGIDSQTTFRNYAQALYNGYINVLKNRNTLLDNMNIGTSTGAISGSANLPIYEYKASKLSTQNTTTGKNLFNINGDVNTRYDGQTGTSNTVNGNDLTSTTNGGSVHLLGQKIYVGTGNAVSMSVKLKSITYSSEPSSNTTVAYITLYDNNTIDDRKSLGIKYSEIGERKSITFVATTDYIFATFGRASSSTSATFTDIQVEIGSSATSYEPYTNGPSPNPNYPQEVKTVKGYRNLFDINSPTGYYPQSSLNYEIQNNSIVLEAIGTTGAQSVTYTYNGFDDTKNYTLSFKAKKLVAGTGNYARIQITIYGSNDGTNFTTIKSVIENTPVVNQEYSLNWTVSGYKYYRFIIYNDASTPVQLGEKTQYYDILFTEGDDILPYVPYGTNYIYTTISDGTNSRNVTIPLNDNEICGIGDYKDELVIDKYGHAKLNKKIGKVVLDENSIGFYKGSTYSQIYSPELDVDKYMSQTTAYSNRFAYAYNNNYGSFFVNTTKRINFLLDTSITTLAEAKNWLASNNVYAYYILATSQLIDLNYNVDLTLYEGTNNITNSEDMDMEIKYIKNVYE